MFNLGKITVIFVTRGKIRSAVFSSSGKLTGEEKIFDWDTETLPSILKEIASSGPNRARVVFGEEFSYTAALETDGNNREDILKQARETIPEELQDNWDFQKENGSDLVSQIAAIHSGLFKFFAENLERAGFQVEAIEPQSVSLARLLPQKGMFLFMIRDEKLLFGAVKDGIVSATFVAGDNNNISNFDKFISGAQKKFSTSPEKIFIGEGIKPDAEIFSKNNIVAESLGLNPLYATALKKDISGDDWNVLNIAATPEKSRSPEKTGRGKFQPSGKEKILALLFALTLLALAGLLIARRIM